MLKTLAATLALSLAAGAAGAGSLRDLSTDCDPGLAVTVGLGASGMICTAGTRRNNAGRADYGAADGAFYPLGLGQDIVFDADPAFAGAARIRDVQGAARGTSDNPAARPDAGTRGAGDDRAVVSSGGQRSLAPTGGPGMALSPLGPNPLFKVSDGPTEDSDLALTAAQAISPVPLPAAGWLLLSVLGALGLFRHCGRWLRGTTRIGAATRLDPVTT